MKRGFERARVPDLRPLLDLPLAELVDRAHRAKLSARGSRFSLCTIMNVRSGRCPEDCAFCAQSARYRTQGRVYPLRTVGEIVEQAARAKAAGATRFSLVASGRGLSLDEVEPLAERIREVRRQVGISVCASLGIAGRETLAVLKAAGLGRYHHNIETSARYFASVVTTHTFEERLATIRAARAAGLEICAGGIIGLGETAEDRLDMALTLAGLDVDSVPINILVPIEGTPLASAPPPTVAEVLRAIALFRLALPAKAIRIAGGRETALSDFEGLAFWAGADAMLIGGYLTVKGRPVETDLRLVEEMRGLWEETVRWEGLGSRPARPRSRGGSRSQRPGGSRR